MGCGNANLVTIVNLDVNTALVIAVFVLLLVISVGSVVSSCMSVSSSLADFHTSPLGSRIDEGIHDV